jgi:Uma2 family endonuclease
MDYGKKFNYYQMHGVKEYWIVNPDEQTILAFILQEDGKYDAGALYEFEGKIPVYIFDNYPIDLNDIFEE